MPGSLIKNIKMTDEDRRPNSKMTCNITKSFRSCCLLAGKRNFKEWRIKHQRKHKRVPPVIYELMETTTLSMLFLIKAKLPRLVPIGTSP